MLSCIEGDLKYKAGIFGVLFHVSLDLIVSNLERDDEVGNFMTGVV
jgi:hypothetical protein